MADTNRLHSINTSRILRTIWQNPGISRIKIAELLDLDRSTVTKIMRVIFDHNLVVTIGKNKEQNGVGRRQICLKINEDIGVVLGMEIQDSRYTVVVTSVTGKILHAFDGLHEANRENLVGLILFLISRAKEWIVSQKLFLLGIGIGLPGLVDPYGGISIRSYSLQVHEPFDLHAELAKKCDEQIFIENDANCCCWSELAFKLQDRSRNFISVLGEFRDRCPESDEWHGIAIGVGIVIRERVLHGDHFTAGEFRSIRATRETGQFSIPCDAMCSLPRNTELLDSVYHELADNLALLVNCVDFTKIVFAGDFAAYPGKLKEYMASAIVDNLLLDFDRNFIIEFSEYGNNSVAIGAAGLFVEKLFSVPDVADRFQEVVGYDLYEQILKRKENNC